ncbi:MAG: tetratricopeptide repeat protein, partial [bacterium]|nr:tetratricopeptide repeat protein [bacterium]
IGPLDRYDAIALVGQVLAASGYEPPPADPGESEAELIELVDAVSCHPRSLVLAADEVVEAGVRATTENLRELMAALHDRHPDDDRSCSLRASVELSLRRLSAATRWMIRPLGVFHGGGHLTAISTVLELDIENDEEVILADQLIAVGLAKMLTQNYMSLHPALASALLDELNEEEREAARSAWAEAMTQLIGYLDQQQIKNPALASTLTLVDLPNLLAVLDYLDEKADAERVIDVATAVERLVEVLGRPQALERVERIRRAATQRLDEWSQARFLAELAAVEQLLESGRHAESAEAAKALLRRVEASEEHLGEGAAYAHAMAYLTLGRALLTDERAEPALAPLNEARTRFRELDAHGGDANARMLAVSSALAGDCLMALGHSDAAAEAYETAIGVARKRDDHEQIAGVRIKLGNLHLEGNRIDEALAAFTEARDYFEAVGDQQTVAKIWHHVASVHERTERFAAAEKAHVAALKIEVRTDQRNAAATTLADLGSLHDVAGRFEDAVDSYRQAAELFSELHDLAREGIARSNVADKLMRLRRYDEARQEILRAIECDKPFGHAAEPWKSFSLLANLERAVDNAAATAQARQWALDAYLDYRRSGGENQTGHREIFAEVGQAVAAGEIDDTASQLAGMLRRPDLPTSLKALIPALQAVLNGSRDPALAADANLYYRDAAELRLLVESLAHLPHAQQEPEGT